MNKLQNSAIEAFRRYLQQDCDRNVKYGHAITKFEVEPTEYGTFFISAQTEYTGLPHGNLLRAISHEFWLVTVGKRGGIVVLSAPKSMKQFIGKGKVMCLFTVKSV